MVNIIKPLFYLTLLLFAVSCIKEDYTKPAELTEELPYEEITARMLEAGYNTQDILEFLVVYGTTTPDVLPAFNNYYQDITGGGSNLGNLSLVDGGLFVSNEGVVITDTIGYTFNWYINDVLQCSEADPKLWDLDNNLECDGVVELTLEVITPSKAIYSRTQWAFLQYNYIENCDCPECPGLFEVFYTFYPDVDPYYYQVSPAKWDLNADQAINTADFLLLLENYNTQ